MMRENKTSWFGPKTMGFGISPASWQGWLITLLLLAAIIGSRYVKPESFGLPHWARAAAIGGLIVLYLLVAWRTYDADS